MKKTTYVAAGAILLSLAVSAYVYPQMPERMASHWNAAGEVNGYMPKDAALFLMPIIAVFCWGLFLLIPKIDPLRKNIQEFRTYYDWFIAIVLLFMLYVHILTLAWNLGFTYNMGLLITPGLAALFYYIGIVMEHAKRNWFIGIRTPWTLSSDSVWEKTHKKGGLLFKISGVIALAGLLAQEYVIYIIMAPVLISSVYLLIYSYLEYRKEEKK